MSEILLIDVHQPEFGQWLEATGHRVSQLANIAEAARSPLISETELVIAGAPTREEEAKLEAILQGPLHPGLILLAKSQHLENARVGFRLGAADVLPPD